MNMKVKNSSLTLNDEKRRLSHVHVALLQAKNGDQNLLLSNIKISKELPKWFMRPDELGYSYLLEEH